MEDLRLREALPTSLYKVGYLQKAVTEGKKILNAVQYAYAVRQAERLRNWADKEEMASMRIEAIDPDLYELKLKGNVLGKINLRIFFGVFDAPEKLVVVVGAYKKEEEDELPTHVKLGMRNRRRVVGLGLKKPVRKGQV